MSRYRKVEVKTYSDSKFRSLSPIPPCGQGLWLYLITGPHTTSIPGLFHVGRGALAEALGWEMEAFDKAFAEVFREGMAKADWTNRVVWIPNAIRHNAPANANVVKSWASELDLIPQCDLKAEALAKIEAALRDLEECGGNENHKLSEAFSALLSPKRGFGNSVANGVANGIGNGMANGIGNGMANGMANQEQEQEQEQEQHQEEEKTLVLASLVPVARPVTDAEAATVYEAYPRKVGRPKALEAIRAAVRELGVGRQAMDKGEALNFLHGKALAYARSPAGNAGKFTPHPATWFNQQRYLDDEREWKHGTGQEHKPIAAVERQRVTRESIGAAVRRRYGIVCGDVDGTDAGAVSPVSADGGHGGDVRARMGSDGGSVRAESVLGRVVEGVR